MYGGAGLFEQASTLFTNSARKFTSQVIKILEQAAF